MRCMSMGYASLAIPPFFHLTELSLLWSTLENILLSLFPMALDSPHTDEELLALLKNGDEGAFTAV
jgi:hypothetical protein